MTATFDQGHKLEWFGTLRGRFGTTITPDVMAYATGGLAVGSIRSTVRLTGVGFDADGNPGAVSHRQQPQHKAGWTVGAGIEGRLFGNVTGKIEYLYIGFRHHLDVRHPRCNATGRDRHQFPHHRQHRARRAQLQVQSH